MAAYRVRPSADAASAQGTIQGVEFFEGTTSLGSAAGPPYSATATLTTVGSHAIFARATDSFGFTADSPPLVLTAQSQPPTVQITSPAAGASFRAPATIALAATASDPDGTVSQVEYFRDGISIGAPVTTAPYALTWSSVPVGTYLLTARALDNTGATGDSTGVSVVVASNVLPQVTLTAPSGSVSYREPASIDFSATASDADGSVSKVEFLLNDVVVGTVTAPPYTFTKPDVAAGSYVAKARATDNDNGGTTSSTTATITVAANAAPSVAITAPTGGATFDAPTDIVITASASDSDGSVAKVEFFAGALLLGTVTAPPYSVIWANAPLGAHTLTAKATDNDGGAMVSAPVGITVNGITAAITAPANGASFTAPAAFDLSATASTSSGNITSMEFYDGATLIYTASIPAGFATANYTLAMGAVAAGAHVYAVKAFDGGGRNVVSGGVTVNVTAPPTVTITAPQPNAYYIAPAIIGLSANAAASAGTITKVEFFQGSTLLGEATAPPFNLSWSNVAAGNYSLTARATDSGARTAVSDPVAISVASGPAMTVDPGLDGSTVADDSVLIAGTTQAGPNAGVSVNGALATLNSGGQYFINNLRLHPGANSIPIISTAQDGQSTTQTITITSSGSAPFKVQVDPAEGAAPLDYKFIVENPGNTPFGSVEFDFNDDGSVEFVATSLESAQASGTLTDVGAVRVRVTVKSAEGAVLFSSIKRIEVESAIAKADRLVGVHAEVMSRLANGDIERALNLFAPHSADKHRSIFEALGSNLAAAVSQFGSIENVIFGEEIATLMIVRSTPGGPQAFMVNLLRGEDGIWRIDGM